MSEAADIINATGDLTRMARLNGCKVDIHIGSRFARTGTIEVHVEPVGEHWDLTHEQPAVSDVAADEDTRVLPP